MTRTTGTTGDEAGVVAPIWLVGKDDVDEVERLLSGSGLPLDDLRSHLGTTLVAREAGVIVASAALELYAPFALLRSVAVAPASRGRGFGLAIVRAAMALAARHRVTEVYLLTETASDFFPRLGFERVARDRVPTSVRQSVEFTSACPASAVAMAVRID